MGMENTQSNKDVGQLKAYVPPKDWEQLTADEKVERMRGIIKSLQHQVGQTQTSVYSLRRKLKNHDHKDGKVYEVKEMTDYDDSQGLGGAASLSNPKYF